MKITLFEAPGLDEFSENIEKNYPNTNNFGSNDLKYLLMPYNVTFAIEQATRLQSLILCQMEDSYVQQSGRYVVAEKNGYVTPKMNDIDNAKYHILMSRAFSLYSSMTIKKDPNSKGRPKAEDYLHGIPIEDARYIFPLCIYTNMVISMNAAKLVDLFMIMNHNDLSGIFKDMVQELQNVLPRYIFTLLYNNSFMWADTERTQSRYSIFDDIHKPLFDKISDEENVVLLNKFENPRLRVGLGAVTSTQSRTPSETLALWGNDAESKARGVTERVMGYGHKGVSEQSRETFGIMVSLVSFHQQIRHRLPDDYNECLANLIEDTSRPVKIPPTIKHSQFLDEYLQLANDIKEFRLHLYNIYGFSVAANLLLFCDQIKQITSTNARMDCEIMKDRLCGTAQWEIRAMYAKKYAIMSQYLPEVYKFAIPPCVVGKCKEGALTCGQADKMKEIYTLD